MDMTGFIHFDCICGLDIYFFGDSASGLPSFEAIETLRTQLGNHQFAIFTSQNEPIVPCPCCDSMIQLPDARIAAFFAKMSLAATANSEKDQPPAREKQIKQNPSLFLDGYSRQLPELN